MKIDKALRRDDKINQRRNGMVVDNRSIFTIQEEQKKKAEQIRLERELKERMKSDDTG
jgi:hypothetical protein